VDLGEDGLGEVAQIDADDLGADPPAYLADVETS
jgi:hypothetical protein